MPLKGSIGFILNTMDIMRRSELRRDSRSRLCEALRKGGYYFDNLGTQDWLEAPRSTFRQIAFARL